LALEYYLGKVHCRHSNLLTRLVHLEEAAGCFRRYLRLCVSLRVVDKDDADLDINDVNGDDGDGDGDHDDDNGGRQRRPRVFSAEEQRSRKIARYKREKEAKERMEGLQVCCVRVTATPMAPPSRPLIAPLTRRPAPAQRHRGCCGETALPGPAPARRAKARARGRGTTWRKRPVSWCCCSCKATPATPPMNWACSSRYEEDTYPGTQWGL